jgi:hypothetical protein
MSFVCIIQLSHALLATLFQVVELDGVIGDLAKRHFGFVENDRMKVTYPVHSNSPIQDFIGCRLMHKT